VRKGVTIHIKVADTPGVHPGVEAENGFIRRLRDDFPPNFPGYLGIQSLQKEVLFGSFLKVLCKEESYGKFGMENGITQFAPDSILEYLNGFTDASSF
jgi:hypothetical protein